MTTQPKQPTPPGLKALQYAEDKLEVHKVYDTALALRGRLDDLFTEISQFKDKKRELDAHREDVEMEVSSDERGRHPDMSQAQMDKHMKVQLSNTAEWRETREHLAKVSGDIDGLEYDIRITETDIKIATARLQELGGYLQYLAAIKEAETARSAKKA